MPWVHAAVDVVDDVVPQLSVGRLVDLGDRARVPLICRALASPEDRQARADGRVRLCDRRRRFLGRLDRARQEDEGRRRAQLALDGDVVLQRARRRAVRGQLELVEGPDVRLQGDPVGRRVVHEVRGVVDAHENAIGDAIARALPADALILVLEPHAFRAEHEGDHPVFVPEVWDLARVALHPRRLAHLGRAAYREPHRVLSGEGDEAPDVVAQVAPRPRDHGFRRSVARVHVRLRLVHRLVLARGADGHLDLERCLDATLELVAVELGAPVELEFVDRVP